MPKHHPLCRPPRGVTKPDGGAGAADEPLRLGDDNKWRPDNGRPARAFLGRLNGEHVAFVADCDCPYTNGCPLGTTLTKADDLGISATTVHRRKRLTVEAPKPKKRKKKPA